MTPRRLLLVGAAVSLALHALAFSALQGPERTTIAGGEAGAVSVVGSLADLVAGSDAARELAPVEPPTGAAVPLRPEVLPQAVPEVARAVAPPVETATPVSTPTLAPEGPAVIAGVTETQALAPATPEPAPAPSERAARPVSPVDPAASTPAPVDPAPVERETVEAMAPERLQPEPMEAAPRALEPAPAAPVEAAPVPPVEETEAETVAGVAPGRPRAKPPVPDWARAAPRPDPTPERTPARTATPRGNADRNARRGGETASRQSGQAASAARGSAESQARGRAAMTNYQGKVLSKLRRAKRYPREAERRRLQGTATLRFTVARDGSVSGGRIVSSSGEASLDRAALDMLRRAGRMPRFPDEIRRSSLTFRVPVDFRRR